MFWQLRERLARFMNGRYGFDRMTAGLLVIYLILGVLRSAVWIFARSVAADAVIRIVILAVLIFAVFRVLSKNTGRRRAELYRYMRVRTAVFNRVKVIFKDLTDRSHKYMICPSCRAVIRFPRKKGIHPANCPKCVALITVRVR